MGVSNTEKSLGLLRNALLMGAVFMAGTPLVATKAFAQTAPAPTQSEEEAKKKADEKVVVTGSRIRRSEFSSPNPIQVITNEQSILRGQIDAANVLQQSSLAAGNQQINNQLTGFVAEGGPGVNTVSLRGLGATRTLVMLNGRRLSPAGTRGQVGAVDLNVLPQSVINRYEILKDGASSIYGSDAVAGVVNGITVRNLDGGGINVSTSQPFESAGAVYRVDGIWGQRYDNGSFMVAAEYYKQEAQLWGDRDITKCASNLIRNVTDGIYNSVAGNAVVASGAPYPASLNQAGNGGLLDIIDPSTGKPKCFNQLHAVVDVSANANRAVNGRYVVDPTAVAGGGVFGLDLAGWKRVGLAIGDNRPFVNLAAPPANQINSMNASNSPGTAALTNQQKLDAWRVSQGIVPQDHENLAKRTYISPVERYSLYSQGEVQISDNTTAYAEVLYSHRESSQVSFRQHFPTIAATNPNNPFGSTASPVVSIPSNGEQEVNFYRGVVGVKGDLFSLSDYFMRDWSYDVYAQGTLSQAKYTNDIIMNDRVNATIGGVACDQAQLLFTGSLPGGNCAANLPGGVQWFRPSLVNSKGTFDGFTQAERNFLYTRETGDTSYEQFLVAGSVSGTLFDLPAGEVAAVLGFERRYDAIDDTPGFNARNNNLWGQTSAGRTQGSDTVVEGFGEIEIPLLADLAFIKNLTFNGSARFTNYDSYGSESTYKMSADWRLTDEYRIRGSVGTSFRAPALYEIFLANQTAFLGQANVDPCINYGSNPGATPQQIANCAADGIPPNYTGVTAPFTTGSATIITGGGGPGVLDAETSDAKTLGFVWTPDWIPFRAAVDYFQIVVNNQVAQFGAGNILTACYRSATYVSPNTNPANDPFCALFVRNMTGGQVGTTGPFGIISVNNSYVNLNSQNIDGLDLTAEYREEIEWLDGTLTVNFQGTFAFDQVIDLFDLPGAANRISEFNGEIYANDFVGNLSARFDTGSWTFSYGSQMFSRASNDEEFQDQIFGGTGLPECGTTATNGLFPAITAPYLQNVCVEGLYKQYAEWEMTHDISVRWREDGWTAQVGVINVFDSLAPTTSTGAGTTRIGNAVAISNYDATGRRLFINLGYSF